MDDSNDLSNYKNRLNLLENFNSPTPFKTNDQDLPEELEVRILAYLTKDEYLTCKLVCNRWDSLRHCVAIMRKRIATPLKEYILSSKRYPSRYWSVTNSECIRSKESIPNATPFAIVPGIYQPGDETSAHDFNQGRFEKEKHTIISFKSVSDGTYLRHCYGWLRSHDYDNSNLYRLDASFYMTKDKKSESSNEDGQDSYTFRSVNYDRHFICNEGHYQLKGVGNLKESFILHDHLGKKIAKGLKII